MCKQYVMQKSAMAKAIVAIGRGLPVAPPLPLTIGLRICLESVVSFPTGVGAEPGRKKMDFMDI